ncbi:coiled-coil domain-containing protein 150-like [Clarias gariepinus]|uniref:coiled-coil domain-containing protein 150-like n=1 Tax=Clarias gariepinus TaxID=13013 RepID=UPI00234C9816|nr:coiled-coil domain-containing protein 150-like [Clarias gariepinus]
MEADSVTRAQLEQEKELKDQESVLSKVEALFEVEHSRNQALKQQTTELKARKSHLELSMRDVKERTAAMLRTKEDLKKELQTLREDHMELLSTQAEQIRAIERSVYENGLMLEQVNMENSRLRLCIEQMKEDIINARKEKETHTQEMSWMKEEVQSIYIRLVDAWITDKLATEESAETDQKFLEAMQMFMLQVQDQERHLGDINSRLEAKLKAMSTVLELDKPQQKLL